MKHLTLLAFFLFSLLLLPTANTLAQTAAPVELQQNDRFVMRNGAVVKQRGDQSWGLTQNVRLPNNTKVNVKSGIVELDGGRIVSLKEGDYVNAKGDIVYASPQNAAAARNETAPADASFNYVDRGPLPATVTDLDARLSSMNRRVELMARKIQLLNQKISLLSNNNSKAAGTAQLDKQIQELDQQLQAVK